MSTPKLDFWHICELCKFSGIVRPLRFAYNSGDDSRTGALIDGQ